MIKTRIFIVTLFIGISSFAGAQTCQTNAATSNFFTLCSGSAPFTDPDDYTIKVKNSQTMVINGDVTITGVLTINLVGSTSKVLIQSPYTLHAGSIVFTGSATGKVFEIEGPDGALVVDGTLDFGGNDIEIDGTGTIDAGEITGAENTSCTDGENGGTGTCPTITTPICDDVSGLCIEDTALPIELLLFSGVENNENVLLKWATASEENFDYFEIERAAQGTSFEIIGEIKGNGDSFKRLDYGFTDENPEVGLNYYRLKSIDFDGTFEYSDVILVKFTSNVKLLVSPNPTLGAISVRTSLPTTDGLQYEITNQYGVIVLTGTLSEFNTQIDLQGLTKGIYIIRLVDLPAVKARRIILK